MAALSGMKQICNYVGKSESTVLKLVREYNFPAKQVLGSWESETVLIDDWRIQLIARPEPIPISTPKDPDLSTR